jgi:phosphate transport system ATP-binding protein
MRGVHPIATAQAGFSLVVEHLDAFYGAKQAVKDVNLRIEVHSVTAIIGPSGCGKSTVLRCLNRMHEVIFEAYAKGKVLLYGEDIYAATANPVLVRRRIGMVFQRPNVFPTMSIQNNVLSGLHMTGRHGFDSAEVLEGSLRRADLWDEVKDQLTHPATALSGGQQQRLCIARAIAVQPEVLLMDEPCSALDPLATLKVEDLIHQLREAYSIVIVTHNMEEAKRVADRTAFMNMNVAEMVGVLVEEGPTTDLFRHPRQKETEDYLTGRFG